MGQFQINIYLNSQVFDRLSNVLKSKHHVNLLHEGIKVAGLMKWIWMNQIPAQWEQMKQLSLNVDTMMNVCLSDLHMKYDVVFVWYY